MTRPADIPQWAWEEAVAWLKGLHLVCDLTPIDELILIETHARALLAAYERGRGEQEWQPIETAPKDGTPVDLWCVNEVDGYRIDDGSHSVGVRLTDCWWEGEWMRIMDDGYWDPVEDEPGGANGLPPWTPTHWMPVLPGPSGAT